MPISCAKRNTIGDSPISSVPSSYQAISKKDYVKIVGPQPSNTIGNAKNPRRETLDLECKCENCSCEIARPMRKKAT